MNTKSDFFLIELLHVENFQDTTTEYPVTSIINTAELSDQNVTSRGIEVQHSVSVPEPRKLLTIVRNHGFNEGLPSSKDDDDEPRVGEVAAILAAAKVAKEIGQVVVPIIIEEIESSPVGGIIDGIVSVGQNFSLAPKIGAF